MEKPTEKIENDEKVTERDNRGIDSACDLVSFVMGGVMVMIAWELIKMTHSYFMLPFACIVLFLTTRAISDFLRKSMGGK